MHNLKDTVWVSMRHWPSSPNPVLPGAMNRSPFTDGAKGVGSLEQKSPVHHSIFMVGGLQINWMPVVDCRLLVLAGLV